MFISAAIGIPPQSVGHRCLARGLSDLAAMGARPGSGLSLACSACGARPGSGWSGFFDGLMALAERYKVPLAGGDMAQVARLWSPTSCCWEACLREESLLRSGARAGDLIYVTGALGGSAAELLRARTPAGRLSRNGQTAGHPHLYPEPRLAAGRKLMRDRWQPRPLT